MNIVSFGGGTNSTAMLIGMYQKGIQVDLIMFANTGAELPHTISHIETMNKWLIKRNMPEITTVEYFKKNNERLSLEQECLINKALPSIAYGFKTCSLKHKKSVQDKFCNKLQQCIDVWASGEKINKYIGFDAGEENRKQNAFAINLQDKKYITNYPLIEWEWYREDCVNVIQAEGIPLPGKSSCFFCPSMKKPEIRDLKINYPKLFDRAIAIEDNAKENFITVKGLGRNYAWKNFINAEESQIGFCEFYEVGTPCSCYDG